MCRDERWEQGLVVPQKAGKLNMVPPFFLSGFKRIAGNHPFKCLLFPLCQSTLLSWAKLHPSSLTGVIFTLDCETVSMTAKKKNKNKKSKRVAVQRKDKTVTMHSLKAAVVLERQTTLPTINSIKLVKYLLGFATLQSGGGHVKKTEDDVHGKQLSSSA